jgi:hypothetical protein
MLFALAIIYSISVVATQLIMFRMLDEEPYVGHGEYLNYTFIAMIPAINTLVAAALIYWLFKKGRRRHE